VAGSPLRTARAVALPAAIAAVLAAGPAAAAPPPNDGPYTAGTFQPYTAANGTPTELGATAELAEAGPDAGIPRCLGPSSFARTVWYVIPPAPSPQEITVEASGRTLAVVDLAAFVQPQTSGTRLFTTIPQACAGVGSGGSDATEEPTSAITMRVPAQRSTLLEVGRRGKRGTPENEQALLSLDVSALGGPGPPGDVADPAATPSLRSRGATRVALAGATLSNEDPAAPACPSIGSVWRRVVPSSKGTRVIDVNGGSATTLTAFAGRRPSTGNALDCVNRAGTGHLQMRVPVKRRQPLWIRLGTDRPAAGSSASITVTDGTGRVVVDGGPGGADPTTGGPGGGLPASCVSSNPQKARIGGPRIAGSAKRANRRPLLPLTVSVSRAAVCDVQLELVGPHGRVYAKQSAVRLRRRSVVRFLRTRTLTKGIYRVRMTAIDMLGERVSVRGALRGRLGK
jgi:hypothetical protein